MTFDQAYFDHELGNYVSRIGGKPTVEVKLIGGDKFQVRGVVKTTTGYVTLEVRPANSATTKVDELVTVAYQAISNVIVSSTSAQQWPKIGYHL
jgi:hypothetical protein